MIYLDYSATNPLHKKVISEMKRVLDDTFGNPSSLHSLGQKAKATLENARRSVADLIDARPGEIIFTSGGSESNNTVINTFREKTIIVSQIEHPSVLHSAETLASSCIKAPVSDQGIVDVTFIKNTLEKLAKEDPHQKILVSVMLANNETGAVQPIKDIAESVKEIKENHRCKIYLHTDATQAVGKIPVSVKDLNVDYLTFTSHKIGGPVGIATLFVKPGAPFTPLILGGSQENKRRAGTSNILLASGFGVASAIAKEEIADYQNLRTLRKYFIDKLSEAFPDAIICGSRLKDDEQLPNIINISFPRSEGESIQLYLDLEGFAVSTGSACASGDLEPSHVLMAMFHDAEIAHGSVRFSLGLNTTKTEIDELLAKLPPIINKIQDLSTIKKEQDVKQ